MAYYYVEDNNWTTNVVSAISTYIRGDSFTGSYNYSLAGSGDDSPNDPAPGCQKEFVVTYACGAEDPKTTSISNAGFAGGKTAIFNCSSTYKKCEQLVLILGDDGSLTVRSRIPDLSGNVLWTNKNDAMLIGLADKALVDDQPRGRNLRSTRNYLTADEFLGLNEYIASTNKKFRLVLEVKGALTEFKVVYITSGCNDTDGAMVLDGSASKLYNINSVRTDIGKIGYVDDYGVLHNYPNSLTSYSNDFELIGNYGLSGADLSMNVVNNVNECKTKCAEYNIAATTAATTAAARAAIKKCVGFVYEKSGRICRMKDDTIYSSGNRFVNNNYEYYMRNKSINTGQIDSSCPLTIMRGTNEDWEVFSKNPTKFSTTNMTGTTKCGLGKYTETETEAVRLADASLNNTFVGSFLSFKDALMDKYTTIKSRLMNNEGSIDASLNDLQNTRRDLGDWTGEQLKLLEAMNEDRDLNRISQNYKHILWSILAIIIIIAAIRITRSGAKTDV